MAPRLAFVLGKPPRPGTIVADVIDRLRPLVECAVLLPHDDADAHARAADADLVVHRGLSGDDLAVVAALAGAGPDLCNPWRGVQQLRTRSVLHAALVSGGVPTPRAVVARSWADAHALARSRRVVVKPVLPDGRGEGVVASPLPQEATGDGPFLVEEFIAHDGTDRKLYLAGRRAFGLLKPSTLFHGHTTSGEPFEPTADLVDLARRAMDAVGLHLGGVDIVIGSDGPRVVDINAFPGYRGVDGCPGRRGRAPGRAPRPVDRLTVQPASGAAGARQPVGSPPPGRSASGS